MSEIEPFVVRGHHLNQLVRFEKGDRSPDEMASKIAALVRRRSGERGDDYATDVLGDTEESSNRCIEGWSAFFSRYAELSPEHPVKITITEPDGICNSCAIGEHCIRGTQSTQAHIKWALRNDSVRAQLLSDEKDDIGATHKFLVISAALALSQKFDFTGQVESTSEDTLPAWAQDRLGIGPLLAPASTVKTVLKHWQTKTF